MNARGPLAAAVVGIVLAVASLASAAGVSDALTKLFDLGLKGTPSAVAAAQTQYAELKRAHSADERFEYAFAVVLVNQRQYRDALPVLSHYLKSSEPELTAFYIKMLAEIPLGNYADVLDQATALSERFPGSRSTSSKPQEKYREAARHLGTIFGYLELVRPTALDGELRTQRKNDVLDRLGKTYREAFDEGHAAVAKRLGDMQLQQKAELEKLKVKADDLKDEAQSKAEATHASAKTGEGTAKSSEKKLEDIRSELRSLQNQLSPLQTKLTALQSRIAAASVGKRGPNKAMHLAQLNSQANKLMTQMAPLQKKADDLKAKEERQLKAAAKDAAAARKAEKQASEADKKLHDADVQLGANSTQLDSKLARISNFAPLPYVQERKRVLGWFAE